MNKKNKFFFIVFFIIFSNRPIYNSPNNLIQLSPLERLEAARLLNLRNAKPFLFNNPLQKYTTQEKLAAAVLLILSQEDIVEKTKNNPCIAADQLVTEIHNNNILGVLALLMANINPNQKTKRGRLPLIEAVKTNDPDMVQILLHSMADINQEDIEGYTPYRQALYNKNAWLPNSQQMIDLLVKNGAKQAVDIPIFRFKKEYLIKHPGRPKKQNNKKRL
ncbi:MAG: hypothetical protein UR26_C0005G0059 [candidate division TM6 bacterium GW2011_GWF2_32_72]|nr:MAG: hypothetical protein UR26_C0005G0059 [candidate division TM6 bacterium GW2011_GWF2_32_72]